MNRPPVWFTVVAAVALAWNVLGPLGILADLRLSAADIAALSAQQRALYNARPLWSVGASIVAVLGGTLGCLLQGLVLAIAVGLIFCRYLPLMQTPRLLGTLSGSSFSQRGKLALMVFGMACTSPPRDATDASPVASAAAPLDLAAWTGTWASDGYGYWVEGTGVGMPKVYSVAGGYCIGEDTTDFWPLYDLQRMGSDGERYLSNRVDPYEFRFDPQPALPNECGRTPSSTPIAVLDALADVFAEHYAFFEMYGVDWPTAVAKARQSLPADAGDAALYTTLVQLLAPLRDSHIKLEAVVDGQDRVHDGAVGDVEEKVVRHAGEESSRDAVRRFRRQYWFDGIRDDLLRERGTVAGNQRIQYGMVDSAVGYLAVLSMGGFTERDDATFADEVATVDAILDTALTQFAQARASAVIVDLSLNTGGYDFIGLHIAGRFAAQPALAYTRRAHDARKTPPISVHVRPSARPRYTGPVYLLTSGGTVSAAEIMVLALRALPNVTHAGETTRGAFSTVLSKTLPNGWQLSLSNEIYLDPQGRSWEGKGVPPAMPLQVFGDVPPQRHVQAVRALAAHARAASGR
ncbi:MAG: S41 family peptidase [Gemmatimonas sp.]|jgi:carboxyl-terminal processing protease|uniref:S41 family peptidase n=2 Tax=Gemmatimonas sp. TaxID=1962908 RepID=UPI0022BC3E89|nr:S41 family peptidase [Gemmatimonas sp.]MCZ8011307.1 S41 family peptidase [Gemmatimonas sp.]MCZ8268898.1 S41 family peptidase [Gemmatimonas sp.]